LGPGISTSLACGGSDIRSIVVPMPQNNPGTAGSPAGGAAGATIGAEGVVPIGMDGDDEDDSSLTPESIDQSVRLFQTSTLFT
jgi:hypothetical protein